MNNDPPSMPSPQGDEAVVPAGGEAVGQTLGHNKLRERIGEGGYGVVYVAEQEEPIRRRRRSTGPRNRPS